MDMLPPETNQEIIKAATTFLGRIAGKPGEELGSLITDQIRSIRFKNQIEIINKARVLCEKHNLSPKIIKYKTLADLINFAGWEDADDMQERWSTLLANSLTDEESESQYNALVHILNQISPVEAKIIDIIFETITGEHDGVISTYLPDKAILLKDDNYNQERPLPSKNTQVSIWNLIRLGCIADTVYFGSSNLDIYVLRLTPLGRKLYEACNTITTPPK